MHQSTGRRYPRPFLAPNQIVKLGGGKGERLVLIPYTFRGRRGFTREIIFREMLYRYIGIIYRRNNTILNDDFPHGLDKCESGRAP